MWSPPKAIPPAPPAGKKRTFGLYKGKIKLTGAFDAADKEIAELFEDSKLFPTK